MRPTIFFVFVFMASCFFASKNLSDKKKCRTNWPLQQITLVSYTRLASLGMIISRAPSAPGVRQACVFVVFFVTVIYKIGVMMDIRQLITPRHPIHPLCRWNRKIWSTHQSGRARVSVYSLPLFAIFIRQNLIFQIKIDIFQSTYYGLRYAFW